MKTHNLLTDNKFLQGANAGQVVELLIADIYEKNKDKLDTHFWLGRTYSYITALIPCLISLRDNNIIILNNFLLKKNFSIEEVIGISKCISVDKNARDNLQCYLLGVPGLSIDSGIVSEISNQQHGYISMIANRK